MFRKIGQVVVRYPLVVVVGWGAILSLLIGTAPAWEDVVLDREFAYLPADSPSQEAEAAFKQAFPRQFHPSELGILLYRENRILSKQDFDFVAGNLQPGLLKIADEEGGLADRSIIAVIHTFKEPGIGALLVSEDRQATLVVLELTTEMLQYRNWTTLRKVDALIVQLRQEGRIPEGLQIAQTGSAAVGRDITQAQAHTARATQLWTLVFVVVLLLILYRSPLLAVVPVISLAVAVEAALRVLALLAQAKMLVVFQGMQVYTAIILYGTGIDYGLFLIARYEEELGRGEDVPTALANALERVGTALTASAATVAFSIGMMAFARFGEFHEAGLSITLSLLIGWCAALTLMPSLLRLIGRRGAFARASASPAARGPREPWFSWERLAAILRRRPGMILLASVLLMLPCAVLGFEQRDRLEYDLLKRPLGDAPSVAGTRVLAEHFPQGITAPVIVLVRQPGFAFQSAQGQDAIAELTRRLMRQKDELGLADLRSLTFPLGTTQQAQDAMDDMTIESQTRGQGSAENLQRQVLGYYVGKGDVTQLQFVLRGNPMARASFDLLGRLEEAVRSDLPSDIRQAHVQALGLTSSINDMRLVTDSDQTRIEVLVAVSVFVILLLLLRRLMVALYLIGSVLLSYFCTLGAACLLFWALDPAGFTGLDWKVPIFLFTILMAIGADYNIFLMTRIHEEERGQEAAGAVSSALVKTGRIITSCGIIMAGTFASLTTGSLTDLRQLGFALSFGVLLDTFVVRPVLVPAFLILVQRERRSNHACQ